jgi:hypothetical protein
METRAVTCPKCQVLMEPGFIRDTGAVPITTPDVFSVQSTWIEGSPRSDWSFWHGRDPESKKPRPIVTYRCPECSYLESYAEPSEGAV